MRIQNGGIHGQIGFWLVISFLVAAPGWCSDVTLKSKPSNAVVYNDLDIKQGETPLYMGPYFRTKHYQVRKKGYLPQNVDITPWSPRIIEVVLKEDPAARLDPKRSTNALLGNNINGKEIDDVSVATLKRLRALKTIRDSGDISEQEYSILRTKILDTLVTPEAPNAGTGQGGQQPANTQEPVTARKPAVKTVTDVPPVTARRFEITCRIADDAKEGPAIIGNGDGQVQRGEVFDLVVVITNAGTTTVNSAACTVVLPEDRAVKAYSELTQRVGEIAPSAVTTNRFNLAVPLSATATAAQFCTIEVREAGTIVAESLVYQLWNN